MKKNIRKTMTIELTEPEAQELCILLEGKINDVSQQSRGTPGFTYCQWLRSIGDRIYDARNGFNQSKH